MATERQLRWAAGVAGAVAAITTGGIEFWMGYQPRPVSGSWSSPFFWSPLPILLAASLVLLAGSLLPGVRVWVRWAVLIANWILALWWVPVALIAVRHHYRPPPQSTEGAYFPYFLVVPAVLVVLSLWMQRMRRATVV